ncbi:hypothetical protein ABE430_13825 [Brevibacillus agri]|uniref:hypothetical protein n=1 Tax=Brevibacillus agri TaxID=51101 RepID=UPI003D1E71B8
MSARKRRYYREDRRPPRYYDEFDEDDLDEDEDGSEITERFVSGATWTILAVLAVGLLLSIAHSLYVPGATENGAYRVVAVSHGQLHAEDMATGRVVSFDDQSLVRAALDGTIKRGDVIRR